MEKRCEAIWTDDEDHVDHGDDHGDGVDDVFDDPHSVEERCKGILRWEQLVERCQEPASRRSTSNSPQGFILFIFSMNNDEYMCQQPPQDKFWIIP